MAESQQFSQKGSSYGNGGKNKYARVKLPKADFPANINAEKPNLPVVKLNIYDKTTPHSETKTYFNPLSGWNNEQGNVTVVWNTKLTRAELKANLELIKNNPNLVQRIRFKNVAEGETVIGGRLAITAVVLGDDVGEKERFKTLWYGTLDARTGTVDGQFFGSSIDVLNIFDNCTRNRGTGEKPEMILRVYRPKDSVYKQAILSNPSKYVPARKIKTQTPPSTEE